MVLEGHAVLLRRLVGEYRRLVPVHALSLLVPEGFRGFRFAAYLGTVTLVLAAGGVAGPGAFPVAPWLVIGGAAWLAAYGVWPVAPILEAVPLLNLADHSRLLMVVHLALAMLAARGLDALAAPGTRRRIGAGAMLIAPALALLWVSGSCPGARTRFGLPVVLVHPALFLALAAVLAAGARRMAGRPIWAWLAVALAVADLYAAFAAPPRAKPAGFPPPPAVLSELASDPGRARAFVPQEVMPANVNMVYGVPALSGYEPSMPQRTWELVRRAGFLAYLDLALHAPPVPKPGSWRLLDLLNVRYILSERPIEDPALRQRLEEVHRGPVALYRNPEAFPRAFAVEHAEIARDPRHALELLEDPRVDLRREVILEAPVPADLPQPLAGAELPPTAEIVEYRPGHVRITAATVGGGYLVFSETFSHGWRAAVDGQDAPVLRANYALISVPVPAGRHEIVLAYRPLRLTLGGAISAVTALVLLAGALVPARRAGAERGRFE
jgi:hypothetical protein